METTALPTVEQGIAYLNEVIKNYESELSLSILERCNCIVTIGDVHTLATDENNYAIASLTKYPTQWSKESAEKYAKEVKLYNGNNVLLENKVMYKRDWYKKELQKHIESRDIMQKYLLTTNA